MIDGETEPINAERWFVNLWEAYAGAIYAFAARRISQSCVEDVVADTFLVAWRRRDDVPDKALPWLYGVAGNVVRQSYRNDDRWRRLLERIGAETPSAVASSENELSLEFRDALAVMDWEEREILLLVGWEGLTRREVADVLGTTPSAARMRLSRARRRFEEILKKQEIGSEE